MYGIYEIPIDGGSADRILPNVYPDDFFLRDGELLFWTDYNDSLLGATPVHGGATTYVVDDMQVDALAVDDDHVYFDVGYGQDEGVWKVDDGGGTPEPLVVHLDAQSMAFAGGVLYAQSYGDIYAIDPDSGDAVLLVAAALLGGGPLLRAAPDGTLWLLSAESVWELLR